MTNFLDKVIEVVDWYEFRWIGSFEAAGLEARPVHLVETTTMLSSLIKEAYSFKSARVTSEIRRCKIQHTDVLLSTHFIGSYEFTLPLLVIAAKDPLDAARKFGKRLQISALEAQEFDLLNKLMDVQDSLFVLRKELEDA